MTKNPFSTSITSKDFIAPLSSETVKFHLFGKRILLLAIGICFSLFLNAQVSKTINLTSAGTLSTVLTADELNSVTNLTITGNIDARDFKTMRDSMPLLAEIDMGGATVAAYYGTEGTNSSKQYHQDIIPESAFSEKNGLKKIILPSAAIEIKSYAFYGCSNLNSVTIPSLVTVLGDFAFYGCHRLTTLFLPASIWKIGIKTFGCGPLTVDPNNSQFASIDGVLFNKDKTSLLQYPVTNNENYIIPSSVNLIGPSAFAERNVLKLVAIPSSVEYIESDAFNGCSGLTSLTLPNSVWELRVFAFRGCTGLKSITIPSHIGFVESGVFSGCTSLSSIYSNHRTPLDLNNAADFFSQVDKIKCKLYVPYGTKSVYSEANQWKDFTNVEEMPGFRLSATQIEVEGTENSTGTVDIDSNVEWTVSSGWSWLTMSPEGGTGMGQKLTITAQGNPESTSRQAIVTISSANLDSQTVKVIQSRQQQLPKTMNVTAGGLYAALTPTERNTITHLTLTGTIDARDFKTFRDEMPLLAVLDISQANIAEYHGSGGPGGGTNYAANKIPETSFTDRYMDGKPSLTSIVLPSSLTAIGSHAFHGCSGLTSMVIPPLVTQIDDYALAECTGLKTIGIPSSLNNLGYCIFQGCSGLSSVTIPSSVTSIGEYCFSYCNNLSTILIPSSVTSIGKWAFLNCKSLTSISLPSSITSIGQGVFLNCTGLKSVNLPSLITTIGDWFNNCTSLDSITIPSSVTTIGSGAFLGCSGLTSVSIPSSVVSIGENAFQSCTGLKSVTIGSSVANIGNYAFNNCSKLTSLTLESKVPPVISSSDLYVFNNVDKNVCTLYIPDGTTAAYTIANQWKDFANIVEASDVIVPTHFVHLSSQSVILASNAGTTATVTITSDSEWTATSDQAWISVNPTNGSGDHVLTFTAGANLANGSRNATVTVSSPKFESKTITLTQFGIKAALNLSPGTLATVLTSEVLSSISNLTLTGSIDARDFKTMRDKMPLLAVLDLSGVTIAAYNGYEGPSLSGPNQYPANTIPVYAFREPWGKSKVILNSVILPSSLNAIGYAAFAGCDKLTTLSIPPNVTFIDRDAFSNCSGLTSVLFPSSQIFISDNSFGKCINLASVTMKCFVPPNENYAPYVFYGVNMDYCTLHVPYGTTSRYAYAPLWSNFENIVEPANGFLLSSFAEKLAAQEGSSVKVNITANVNWTASSDQTWLSISPAQGSTNQTITFTARENTASFAGKARVTISANNIEPQTIIITQDGANLTLNLSPGSLTSALTSDELQTVTSLTITGSIDARDFKTFRDEMPLLVKLDLGNVTIAEYHGDKGTCFDTDYPANTLPSQSFYEKAYGIIPSISSIVLPKSLTSINGYAFGYQLTSLTVDFPVPPVVFNSGIWTIGSNTTLYVPYGAANSYKATAKWKEFSHIVESTQGFHLSTYQPTLAGEDGSRTTVDLTANIAWAVSSDQDWLAVSPLSGNGNQTITFIAKANPLFTTRTAIVTVSGTGVSSQTLTVTQNFKIQPLKTLEVTAGGLSTALSTDELNTISKLTLTGTIDARDFKTMRDKMPVLAELDLSGANIVSYNGNDGTSVDSNTSYSANTIPYNAFTGLDRSTYILYGKTSLHSVAFPSSLISIGYYSFGYCSGITDVVVPSLVTSIAGYSFYYCKVLKSITVKWQVPLNMSSSDNAFYQVDKNTCTLYVPYGTTNRYATANEWKDFTHIVEMPGFFLPATTSKIGSGEGSKSAVDINSDVTWTASSDQAWLSVSPSTGTGIGKKLNFTANGNSSITHRIAKVTVSAIGLESQTITVAQDGAPINITPGSLATVLTTDQLNSITELTLTGTIDARDFKTIRDKMPLLTMLDISGATIVEYTGKEGTNQYTYQNTLYPANTIPENAFYNLNKISSIILPPSLTSIGKYAFANCSSLSNIDFPISVTSIGNNAFSSCVGMSRLTIPSSVTTIGASAFENCHLTSIIEKSSIPPGSGLSPSVFYNVNKNKCTLYVPFGTTSLYRAANQWRDFKIIVEDSEGFNVSSYLENLSYTSGSNATVTINSNINWTANSDQTWLSISPASGTGIAQKLIFTAEANPLSIPRTAYVSISASGVESQTITVIQAMKPQPPKTLEIAAGDFHLALTPLEFSTITNLTLTGTIDARDFKIMRDNMPLLASLDLSGVTIVAYNGPDGTSNTGNKEYPKNTIPEYAFYSNNWNVHSSLTTIVFPESLTAIGQYAFDGCGGLNNVTLPVSVTDIGSAAFFNCSGLTTINITSKVTSIGIQAFGAFSGLITVDPDNLNFSAIEGVLFNKTQTELIQCPISKSGKYTIPSTVLSIGYGAFVYCSKLTGVVIPSSVLTIGSYAFHEFSGFIGTLSIPSSVVSIERNAFSDCWGITTLSIPTSVTSIQGGAFMNCYGLSSIYAYSASPINLEKKFVFTNVNKTTCTLYVPYGSKGLYQMAEEWKDFKNIVELNSGTIANAGPDQVINEGQVVTLDGTSSKSNNNNNPLSYKWTAPSGIILSSETPSNPTFIAPEVTTETSFTFSLIINDGSFGSEADEVIIIVKQINKAPTANAGTDQSVNENSFVTLEGSASADPDNDKLNYLWTAPTGISLSSETASNPTFTAPEVRTDTTFTFSLTVNDGSVNSTANQVKITVKQVNKAPVANAGKNQSVNENSLVTLDGSASSDPDRDELSYLWTAPAGISLSSVTAKNPTFIAPEVSQDNIYRFILLVNDGKTDSDTSQVSITVKQVLPVLKLVSKTSDSRISSTEVTYQFYLKTGNSFSEESVTPVMNGDTTEFSLEPGEWIVLASPSQNPSLFVPTYSGNTLDWINAEHIFIPEKGTTFNEITGLTPEVAINGTGQISGYVYEKADAGTKSISLITGFEASGNPVSGALIRLFRKGNSKPVLSIFTDAQGYYKFDQLEISEYQIEVEIPGFTQSEKFGIAISADQPLAVASFGVNTTSQVITDTNELLSSYLKIYPNPVVRYVTVETGKSITKPYSILVYSLDGELLINQVATASRTILDFSKLAAGSYLIQLCSGIERQSALVIKKR